MSLIAREKIFSVCAADAFTGRQSELEQLIGHAKSDVGRGRIILAEPSSGSSELLRQTYDHLFFEQSNSIPFYFEIRPSDRDVRSLSTRFVRDFLLQTVAFRRQKPNIIAASPDIDELSELATPSDGYWIDRLVEAFRGESKLDDDRSFARNSFSAPLRAISHGARSFVMIDGLHNIFDINGGETLIEDLTEIFRRMAAPFVLCGHRRSLFAKTPFKAMRLERLNKKETAVVISSLAANSKVELNDQTRDLIAVQLNGDLNAVKDLIASAAESNLPLDNFEKVEQLYTQEIFGGRTARRLDAVYASIIPNADNQKAVLELLAETMTATEKRTPLKHWTKRSGIESSRLRSILERLSHLEIVDVSSEHVEFDAGNILAADHAIARSHIARNERPRGSIVGDALAANIRRAPKLMARHYRRASALGLCELLGSFDGRPVPLVSIDHSSFKSEFLGSDDDKIIAALRSDNEKIALPRIVYAAPASAFYRKIRELTDDERAAVALGFDSDGEEVAIIAAEIESKLEATREQTEFWCDRLEMVAHNSDLTNFRLWIVAPEGFDEEAMQALTARNAYGSNRRQVILLGRLLNAKVAPVSPSNAEEYEIVVPMGDDTEIISARAVEDIAKRHNFSARTINQIKTALVEACINATEHSMSTDRRIFQKFVVDDEKLTITVVNRGVRLADKSAQPQTDEKRRGWGLKLMRSLMDDVKIEHTDDGTRLTLIKFLENAQKAAE